MKTFLLLTAIALAGAGCAGGSAETSEAGPSPSPSEEAAQDAPPRDAEIYSAVIRRLAVEDHTSSEDVFRVYVVDGEVPGAGDPMGNPFGPVTRRFERDVIAGVEQRLADELPLLRFVGHGRAALRTPARPGTVKKDGVMISLGPIEKKNGRVHVPNTLWCGGKCSRWQTYVLSHRNGRWVITGTSGPVAIS